MIKLNSSRKLAARPRADILLACRGVALTRSQILFLLAGWVALVPPLRADNPPTYLFEIDSSAVPGGILPRGVALDTSNNVYVTDYYTSRIVKLAGNGTYLTQWGSFGTNNGQFSYPYGIAVDRSNNVYVADAGNSRVEKFDSNGNYLTQWGSHGTGNSQFSALDDVAVDRSNNVYVTDSTLDRVVKFDSNGNYLTQWGSLGTNNGQFSNPYGIAIDSSNNVYVVDQSNSRVQKFDSNGNYLSQWGSNGTGNGQFFYPYGVAVDSSNNVYVTDNINRVEKFDSNGNYLAQWGTFGHGNGQFFYPTGVAVNSSGNYIYVADFDNNRIEVFVNNTDIGPPFITSQPVSQTVPVSSIVTFSLGLIGAAPFAYQWNSNNVALPNATNATFTLTNVSLSASGSYYSVLVTNNFGSALSSNAVLTVFPILVTTGPASGISATGAVLNGLVTVGQDETVAWFDWGTDTNYGNIAGATVVPGNNGSNNISVALNGLNGNFYHYRLDAANDFGIVYGNDQSFTVGFAPTATTLPAVNSTNGSTLNATVNPEGWDTTVYFQWGTPTLTNSTPGIDIGAGATSLNVSSFVTGLVPSTPYQYRVVASNDLGTVFGGVWSPPFVSVSGAAGVVFTSLYSFTGTTNDGAHPYAGLVQGSDGNFYGTTSAGGLNYFDFFDFSTVFKISANGVLTRLVILGDFNVIPGLMQASDGYLYGTIANAYGPYYGGYGDVVQISTNGLLTILYSFNGYYGWDSYAGLVQGTDGNFYGTTYYGGDIRPGLDIRYPGQGNVFKISPGGGAPTSLLIFGGTSGESVEPNGLVQGSDGNFYFTTSGGIYNAGTVSKISSDGAPTGFYSFTGTNDGAKPHAGLVQGRDGNFYGTTSGGGTNGHGTVFQIGTNMVLTSLHSFTGNDGGYPEAALVQGSDGYLYGTTEYGGSSGSGTVFAVNTNGMDFTTLYSFSAGSTNSSGVYTNSDGANPRAGLILSGNTLYGTASAGGIWGDGTVFSIALPVSPQLTITLSGTNVILSWPTNVAGFDYSGFTLEWATNLVSPIAWNTNSTPPVGIIGQKVVTNPIIGTQMFYRLH
jgi:uncharacterized repeat protein (TIGR03803 family)